MTDADPLDTVEKNYSPIEPVYVNGGDKNKKNFLEWKNNTLQPLLNMNRERVHEQSQNLYWYTGEWEWLLHGRRAVTPGSTYQGADRRVNPVVINHLYDLTEQRISRLSRYKPAFDVLPANEEYRDRVNATLQKKILDFIARRQQVDFKITELERWNSVFGEIYLMLQWDESSGDKVGKEGKRTGDVTWKIKDPRWIFLDPKKSYDACRWAFEIVEVLNEKEAERKYDIKLSDAASPQGDELKELGYYEVAKGDVVVWRFIYKPDEMLPNGLIVTWCNGEVISFENEEYPYSHGEFPWERHTDIDVPSRLHGVSFYRNLKVMQHLYNKQTAMIARNIALCAHPKWMMPRGACNIKALGNTATVVEFKGPSAPQLVTFQTTSPEVFGFRDSLRDEMSIIAGIQGVSRGEPPPGVKAGIALQFLEEQEASRANTQIIKHNDLIRRAFSKTASVVGDYYPKTSKERLIRIVGKSNEWSVASLAGLKASSGYDIVILNSTALSESKAGRIQQIIELNQYCPGLVSPEQQADILDLAQPNKFYDIATAAIKQAESENEDILDGRKVSDPSRFEEHVQHWKTHMIRMQSRVFKEMVPEEEQQALFDHVGMHEMLMFEILQTNPNYQQLLQQIPNWPIFFKLPPPMPVAPLPAPGAAPMPGGPMPQGSALGGLPPDAMPPLEGAAPEVLPPSEPGMAQNEQPVPGEQK